MLTTDLSLRLDPAYERISRRFLAHPEQFAHAFSRAWFKLTHRDMGRVRYLGPEGCGEAHLAGPHPRGQSRTDRRQGHRRPQSQGPGFRLVRLRARDDRLGFGILLSRLRHARRCERARIRLAPQKDWEVNQPAQLAKVLRKLEGVQVAFNSEQSGGKRVSLADLIVLGGCAGVEQAARNAGHEVTAPFTPGRMDASQEQTDVQSFAVLEPAAGRFRNYVKGKASARAEDLLVDKAQLLTLTTPEMTVLRRNDHVCRVSSLRASYLAYRVARSVLAQPSAVNEGYLRNPTWES